jgi:membrane fusion protein (multidrug efflux system)
LKTTSRSISSIKYSFSAGLLLFVFLSCKDKETPSTVAAPQKLNTLIVKRQSKTIFDEYAVKLEGRQTVEIRPKVTGFIKEILIEEGQKVSLGQTLFRLETESLSNDAAAAAAAVEQARLEVEKLEPLVAGNIISPIQLKSAQAKLQQAQNSLASIKATVGFATIKSPVNGFAGSIPFKVGALVSSNIGQPLTVVSDIEVIRAYFSLTEKQVLKLKTQNQFDQNGSGVNVSLTLADGRLYPHTGNLAMINPIVDATTGSVTARADFPNPDYLLSSGGSGRIQLPYELKDVFVLPMTATVDLQGSKLIFTVDADGTVHSMPIEIIGQSDTEYLVSNLKDGTRIVSEGVSRLKDEQQIVIANP